MSIQTYSDLQTAVTNWLQRANMAAIVPDLIMLGELRIFKECRIRVMESAFDETIASGVIPLPSDYLELKFAYLDSIPSIPLKRAPGSQIYQQYPYRNSVGKPQMIGREGSNFIFGPYPDSDYTVKGIYYARPVSIQTEANALFLANPDLYLFAALCEAAPYLKDDNRIQLWEGKYNATLAQAQMADADEYGSGGGLEVRCG